MGNFVTYIRSSGLRSAFLGAGGGGGGARSSLGIATFPRPWTSLIADMLPYGVSVSVCCYRVDVVS